MGQKISPALFQKNRDKLKAELDDQSVAVFFSNKQMPRNGDQFFPFRQNSDFFYLTGIEQPESILILTDSEEYLFIKQPDPVFTLWEGDILSKDQATAISSIQNVHMDNQFLETWSKLLKNKKTAYFNIAFNLTKSSIKTKDEAFFTTFRKRYPFHQYLSVKSILKKLRLHKEPEETEQIKQGIEITRKAFLDILQSLKPGITEKQIEAQLRYNFMINGSSGPAYDPIIASGKNACVLHYTKNKGICNEGDLLLMDIGAEVKNYASDISRTIPVAGKFTERQREYYQAVLNVHDKIIEMIRPGISIAELNKTTKRLLTEKHLELNLYKEEDLEKEDLAKKYFPHGVSHFMGLDVHDVGDRDVLLEEGMVITCEPGLYIPEENIGIRIEDDILVGETPVNLSGHIPKSIKEIENLTGIH